MRIILCGTMAKTKLGEIEGMIIGVTIRFSNIIYEFAYFLDGEQKVIWLNENEFTTEITEKITVGFKKN